MSRYSRFEQTIGSILGRFPRLKSVVENTYQRANYHLFVDGSFTHELHPDATLHAATERFGGSGSGGGSDRRQGDGQPLDQFVGFYDVCPWNGSMDRYLLHRLDGSDGRASLVTLTADSTETVARTAAWNYQQGSRAQWHPTRENAVLFNDIVDGRAVARVVDSSGDSLRTYDRPVQAANPVAEEFISLDYRRLDHNSPGYGYGTGTDRSALAQPANDGLFRVHSEGSSALVVSLAELRTLDVPGTSEPRGPDETPHERQYLHHVTYAPDGERFAFLHRWQTGSGTRTRLVVAGRDGDPRVLLADPLLSHFAWLDGQRLLLWGRTDEGRGYHVVDVETGDTGLVDSLAGYGDGHPSVSPDGRWVVTDTYPDRRRTRHLILYEFDTGRVVDLGAFLAPFGFDGHRRCDLHPRWSPDGRFVSVDSAHERRRDSYLVDVSDIVG